MYDNILRFMWRGLRWMLPVAIGGAAAVVLLTSASPMEWTAVVGVPTAAGVVTTALRYLYAWWNINNEPADISFSQYIRVPNYTAELGFVHHVEDDLQRVFDCIPDEYKPLVVFIDDLDRCSPGKVAQVMEAVNLFLAGEFPDCIFILGMDSELVAAALQAAHREMLGELAYRTRAPIGWRFMDKFIQLPFIIPPCEHDGVEQYTAALFPSAERNGNTAGAGSTADVEHSAQNNGRSDRERTAAKSDGAVVRQESSAGQQERARRFEELIRTFDDSSEEVQALLAIGKPYFRGNPREMKRFANTFRFHYFIYWKREIEQNLAAPTPEQVVRWTVLAMKWPEVARWLHSGFAATPSTVDSTATGDRSGVRTRLLRIEECCTVGREHDRWKEEMVRAFDLDHSKTYWLHDPDLYAFFASEHSYDKDLRLSAGAGRGLW